MRIAKILGVATIAGSLLLGGCLGKKKTTATQQSQTGPAANDSVAPDKVLYQRSVDDLNKNHYEVARLSLQALINTYPDSEYLAKAKLAIADSYYKEGSTSGLTQAVNEYKDFITFFPFLDEAAYAQMQVGMAHYRRVEKSDRDRTEAEFAEQEFQVFLQKYPQSPLVPQVQQQLRNVQEILADGEFKIAQYYNTKGDSRAAAGRLLDVVARYPLYSNSDKASFMLANIYERNEKTQYAGAFYTKIVKDYPLSPFVPQAKNKLTKMGIPIPQPDATALARMQQEQQTPHPRAGLLHRVEGPLEGKPDMSAAARVGEPQMSPPDEGSELETLVRTTNLNVSGGIASGSGGSASSGSSAASGAGTTSSTDSNNTSTPPNAAAVQLVTPGAQPTPGPAANGSPAPAASGTAPPSAEGNPPAGQPNNNTQPSATGAAASTAPAGSQDQNGTQAQPCSSTSGTSTATGNNQQSSSSDSKMPPAPCKQDNSKESSSKKKKGLKKLIPWG